MHTCTLILALYPSRTRTCAHAPKRTCTRICTRTRTRAHTRTRTHTRTHTQRAHVVGPMLSLRSATSPRPTPAYHPCRRDSVALRRCPSTPLPAHALAALHEPPLHAARLTGGAAPPFAAGCLLANMRATIRTKVSAPACSAFSSALTHRLVPCCALDPVSTC